MDARLINKKKKIRKSKFVHLPNARTEEQTKIMREILLSGKCPFCAENLSEFHKKEIIVKGSHWLLTDNQWPYKNTKFHFLLILKDHCEMPSELVNGARIEFWDMVAFIEKRFQIKSGGLCMRFGDPKDNGGTVRHLHTHLIVPDKSDPKADPVRFKIW